MLKYFEGNQNFDDKQVVGLSQFVRFLLVSTVLSPFRLLSEISKKILFTGEELSKFLVTCLYINLFLSVYSVSTSLLIHKGFAMYGNLLPLPSLVISFVVFFLLYSLSSNLDVYMDFEHVNVDKSVVEESVDKIKDVYKFDDDEGESLDFLEIEGEDLEDNSYVDKIVEDIVVDSGVELNDEIKLKLENLAESFKVDHELFSPEINIASLYNSENKLDEECVDMLGKNSKLSSMSDREELLARLNNPRKFDMFDDVDDDSDAMETPGRLDRSCAVLSEMFSENVDSTAPAYFNEEKLKDIHLSDLDDMGDDWCNFSETDLEDSLN